MDDSTEIHTERSSAGTLGNPPLKPQDVSRKTRQENSVLVNWTSQVLNSTAHDRTTLIRLAVSLVLVVGLLIFPRPVFSAEGDDDWSKAGVEVHDARITYLDSATLASSRLGIIKHLHVREGTQVDEGTPLLELDDRVVDAQLKTARKQAENKVELEFAKRSADLARAEWELNLAANIRVPGAVPQIEVERLRLAYARALLQIKQARHQSEVDKLKSDEASALKDTYHINAEFPGIVTKIHKFLGEGIREGDPILDISDPSRVKVQGYINFAEVHRVKKGDKVKVKLNLPDFELDQEDLVFDGELVFVDTSVDFVRQQEVRVWAEVKNPDMVLRQGFLAKMVILTDVPPPVRKPAAAKTAWLDLEHLPVMY